MNLEFIVQNTTFSQAFDMLRDYHYDICRIGWNGKGMYVYYGDRNAWQVENMETEFPPFLVMVTPSGQHQIGWIPSMADLFAEDWCVIKRGDYVHHIGGLVHVNYINNESLELNFNELLQGLNEVSKTIHQINVDKGFWNYERNVGEMLMLVVSELGEAMEAHRKGKFSKRGENSHSINVNQIDDTIYIECFEKYVKDTFEDEIAGTIVRLLDLCSGLGIDIETQIALTVKYNKTRPFLHGKLY